MQLTNIFNVLKITRKKNFFFFDLRFTVKTFQYLKLLKKIKIIKLLIFVKKIKWTMIRAYLPLRFNKNFNGQLKSFSTPSKNFRISLRALKLLIKRTGSGLYLISSSQGIVNHLEALKLKTGGIVIAFISY